MYTDTPYLEDVAAELGRGSELERRLPIDRLRGTNYPASQRQPLGSVDRPVHGVVVDGD